MEQENILNTHFDTLNEWYESAEKTAPRIGDTYIAKFPSGDGYEFGIVDSDGLPQGMLSDARVLARSEKPTPAWHNAVVISAETQDFEYRWTRRILTRDDQSWIDAHGSAYHLSNIRDVTPLIEQKVTDEMRDRVRDYYRTEHQVELPRDDVWLNDLLTVALGLDPA